MDDIVTVAKEYIRGIISKAYFDGCMSAASSAGYDDDITKKYYTKEATEYGEKFINEYDYSMYQECPECHMKTLEVTAHCATCINCGYSLCGI